MKSPKLSLNELERKALKQNKMRINEIISMKSELLLNIGISEQRAKELKALVEFQSIPSIGYEFAKDLISLGFYCIEDLKGKDPASLFNDLEQLVGVYVDPCVEDQFRLVVHYSEHPNSEKQWWNFTEERKKYRSEYGYPKNRPGKVR